MTRPPNPDSLAYRLWLARTKRKLSQQELADKAGMRQPNISKLEKGQVVATAGIARLAAVLGVASDWLELGTGGEPVWDDESGGPPLPPIDFSDRRQASESDWGVLQDLADMPSSESEALKAEIHRRAESYRAFMRESLARIRNGLQQQAAAPVPATPRENSE